MNIKESAIEVIRTLTQAGHIAYFAGGWVRDYIMKHPSDDIDIATDASPEEIIALFPRTIQVGIAFGVVVVLMHGHQFEVASFRKDLGYTGGRRPDNIELSSPEEDAKRRDFTINGMFYDPLTDTIHDYVHGIEDIQRGIIRTIGNPNERFAEDRLRMIRAIRFASRFDFSIDEETQRAIQDNSSTLFPAVAMERIWQEFNKMTKSPRFDRAIVEMHRVGLLPVIFPALRDLELGEIQERVAHFPQIPKGMPAILYLMELFPDMPLDELLELCQYLRTSVQEGKLMEFVFQGKLLIQKEKQSPDIIESTEWANFYADRFFHVCFDLITARHPESERKDIIDRHHHRRGRLMPHIQRLMDKKPLVNAALLQDCGIEPGKTMGMLLREAERIAVTRDIHDPAEVVSLLKETNLWPK